MKAYNRKNQRLIRKHLSPVLDDLCDDGILIRVKNSLKLKEKLIPKPESLPQEDPDQPDNLALQNILNSIQEIKSNFFEVKLEVAEIKDLLLANFEIDDIDAGEVFHYPITSIEELETLKDQHKYHEIANRIVTMFGFKPTPNVHDDGYDGVIEKDDYIVIAEVKAGGFSKTDIRSFSYAISRQELESNKPCMGIFMTCNREPTTGMKEEAEKLRDCQTLSGEIYPKFQFLKIREKFFKEPDSLAKNINLPKWMLDSYKESLKSEF